MSIAPNSDLPALQLGELKVVLASGSPQRLSLLKQIGVNPKVLVSNFPENLSKELPVSEFVEETARFKAVEVAERLKESRDEFDVIIACDTVIYFEKEIIGKPKDADEALRILRRFNNREHSVFTGVTLIDSSRREKKFNVETRVVFGDTPDAELQAYVETGEPLGRAGAYGIQLRGSALIKEVYGCYNNVVGIPIFELVRQLRVFLRK